MLDLFNVYRYRFQQDLTGFILLSIIYFLMIFCLPIIDDLNIKGREAALINVED